MPGGRRVHVALDAQVGYGLLAVSGVTNATGATMADRKTLSRMLIAALLITGVGSASTESHAKSPGSGDSSATQKQGHEEQGQERTTGL